MGVREDVAAALERVPDPAGGGSVTETGRAGGIVTRGDGSVGLVLAVDGLDRAAGERLREAVETAARGVTGVRSVRVTLTADRDVSVPAPATAITRMLAVASGKGGVGKSTVAVNLAVALARAGWRIGLLDADIYGPSAPTLLGIAGRAGVKDGRLQPAAAHGLRTLSIGLMTDPNKAVAWRGPMAASAMVQMVEQADWGDLDLLVIDLPPGTGDIQLTMAQKLKPTAALIVSTPQDLALIDARRAVALFGEVRVPVLGLVENMSGFRCPHCGESTDVFGHGGAAAEAAALGLPLLGAIPLDAGLRAASDAGKPPAGGDGPQAALFGELATRVAALLAMAPVQAPAVPTV